MEDETYGNRSIPFLENSYKMIPDATFNSEQARRLAEDVLYRNFKAWNTRRKNAKSFGEYGKSHEELKNCVKGLGCKSKGCKNEKALGFCH